MTRQSVIAIKQGRYSPSLECAFVITSYSIHYTKLYDGLVAASEVAAVTDSYRLWTGKRKSIDYRANQVSVTLANADGHNLVVVLRLSDDGLAYRYELPGESEDGRVVVAERSGVHFFPATRAWLQPKAEAQSGWSNVNRNNFV